MGKRRKAIRLGGLVGLLLGCVLAMAHAPRGPRQRIPGIPDCKDAPSARAPGQWAFRIP